MSKESEGIAPQSRKIYCGRFYGLRARTIQTSSKFCDFAELYLH